MKTKHAYVQTFKQHFNNELYLLLSAVTIMLFMTLFRVVATVVYTNHASTATITFGGLVHAMLVGMRFDSSITANILALPLIMTFLAHLLPLRKKIYFVVLHLLVIIPAVITFFISCADVPWFCYSGQRITYNTVRLATEWRTAANMVIQESSYFVWFFVFLATSLGFILIERAIRKRCLHALEVPYQANRAVVCLLAYLFITPAWWFGVRGHVGFRTPLEISYSWWSNNNTLNMITQNPTFNFITTYDKTNSINQTSPLIVSSEIDSILLPLESKPSSINISSNINIGGGKRLTLCWC